MVRLEIPDYSKILGSLKAKVATFSRLLLPRLGERAQDYG
jgi:hypothetical protein